jgi:hypothetical protein
VARWVARPVTHADIRAAVGVLSINGTPYTFVRLLSAGVVRLSKADGTTYQVARDPDTGEVSCDCPDATYRPGCFCKHRNAVLAALLHSGG